MNQFWPAPADFAWSGAAVVLVVLLVVSIWEILRSPGIGILAAAIWIVVVVAAPVVGVAAWFFFGRPRMKKQQQPGT